MQGLLSHKLPDLLPKFPREFQFLNLQLLNKLELLSFNLVSAQSNKVSPRDLHSLKDLHSPRDLHHPSSSVLSSHKDQAHPSSSRDPRHSQHSEVNHSRCKPGLHHNSNCKPGHHKPDLLHSNSRADLSNSSNLS